MQKGHTHTLHSENKRSTPDNAVNPVDRMTDSCQQGGRQDVVLGDSVVTVPCQAEPKHTGHDSAAGASRF